MIGWLVWMQRLTTGGTPDGAFDASTCNPNEYFKAQQLILNINLCGEYCT